MIQVDVRKTFKSSSMPFSMDVQLEISKGEFASLSGPSGSGKTSILRMIAGFLNPDDGFIKCGEVEWFNRDKRINLIAQKRNVGILFQDYALFPNMTVSQNLEYAFQKKVDKDYIQFILSQTGLEPFVSRYPQTLSGGQKQRVALARALVRKPSILFLDEPFSSLDYDIRFKLQEVILNLHKELKLTIILVTHDISEVYRLSDKTITIENGKVLSTGGFRPKELSGKVQLMGNILDITSEDLVYIVTIASGNNILKVVATRQEASDLNIGDKVMVSSKAFNPVIFKIK